MALGERPNLDPKKEQIDLDDPTSINWDVITGEEPELLDSDDFLSSDDLTEISV